MVAVSSLDLIILGSFLPNKVLLLIFPCPSGDRKLVLRAKSGPLVSRVLLSLICQPDI